MMKSQGRPPRREAVAVQEVEVTQEAVAVLEVVVASNPIVPLTSRLTKVARGPRMTNTMEGAPANE